MKYLTLLCFVVIVTTAYAQKKQQDQFTITGTVAGQTEGYVYLSYSNKENKYIRDSSALVNGKFKFSGFIDQPTIASFHGKQASRSVEDPNSTDIFLEPGDMQITVTAGQFKSLKVTGSRTQLDFAVLQQQKLHVQQRWKIVLDTLREVNKRSNFAYQELRDWVLMPYFAEMKEMDYVFYDKHPSSYATAYYLRFDAGDLTTDSLKLFYDRFPPKLQQSSYGKTVFAEIEKRKIGVPGTTAKEFTTTDLQGQKLSLADYKGKYVLIDFWASWCLPCRKGSPHLMELYAKYKGKGFEVLGVASDDGHEDKWREAIAQDKTDIWKHVLSGYNAASNKKGIGGDFNIQTLPTQILIDPKGTIIGRYSEGAPQQEALDRKLDEVFR